MTAVNSLVRIAVLAVALTGLAACSAMTEEELRSDRWDVRKERQSGNRAVPATYEYAAEYKLTKSYAEESLWVERFVNAGINLDNACFVMYQIGEEAPSRDRIVEYQRAIAAKIIADGAIGKRASKNEVEETQHAAGPQTRVLIEFAMPGRTTYTREGVANTTSYTRINYTLMGTVTEMGSRLVAVHCLTPQSEISPARRFVNAVNETIRIAGEGA